MAEGFFFWFWDAGLAAADGAVSPGKKASRSGRAIMLELLGLTQSKSPPPGLRPSYRNPRPFGSNGMHFHTVDPSGDHERHAVGRSARAFQKSFLALVGAKAYGRRPHGPRPHVYALFVISFWPTQTGSLGRILAGRPGYGDRVNGGAPLFFFFPARTVSLQRRVF